MSIGNHPVEHEELMAYLDGELEADHAADTADHLEHCPQCRQLAADLKEVSAMLATWQVEEAEREPAMRVLEALKQSPAQGPAAPERMGWRALLNPRRWPKPVWGLAGISLALIAWMTLAGRHGGQKQDFSQFYAPEYGRNSGQPALSENQVQSLRLPKAARGYNSHKKPAPASRRASAPPGYVDSTVNRMQSGDEEEADQGEERSSSVPGANGPMIIRTAELEVTTDSFDKARPAVEEILKRHHGYVGELNVNTPTGSARSLSGTLRVPANELEATLTDLKGLGRTENETQGGQEVTAQYVDLQARLANSKHTEQRLVEMLRDRTGKLSDVLAVEMQISRVRGEIEQMEAQRKTMKNQVDMATITINLSEAYKARLKAVPPSTGTKLRNAAVKGYKSLVDGILALLMWLLSAGPTLLVWAAILFWPARYAWKRIKPRLRTANSN